MSDGTNSAEYVYLANSSLLTNVVFKHGGNTVTTTSKTYDNLNRLQSISSATTQAVVSSHAYLYNSANHRVKATLADGSYWEYEYDALGQVTNGVKRWVDDVLVAGQQFQYTFDSIGNRTAAKSGGDQNGLSLRTFSYTANSLNQFTQRTVPGSFDVIGTAQSNAIVTVNNHSVYRRGDYFWKELSVTNTASAIYTNVSVVGVKNNVGTNQEDAVTAVLGNEYVPATPETYTYDLDGNLSADGRWTYTWDGENRLIRVESLTNAPSASKRKLEFAYDHQGRRLSTKTYTWSTNDWSLVTDHRFIYDGWNLQAILDLQSSILQSFMWGLDLSGKEQGAGGVGGLLTVTTPEASHFYAYDGNGNVKILVQADAGSVTATYEYGPFGETIRTGGAMGDSNLFRFSTKYQDDESQVLDFGMRFYSVQIGRWLSRDPIGQTGGPNLYGFVNNDPVGKQDRLGLSIVGNCHLKQYLIDLAIPYAKAGNTYSLPATATLTTPDLNKLIIIRMLKSPTSFRLAGSGDDQIDNLEAHIAARIRIVNNALNSRVRFGTGPVTWRDASGNTVSSGLATTDPAAFYSLVNNSHTIVACQRWTSLLFAAAIGNTGGTRSRNHNSVFIPGDWGMIRNTSFRPNDPTWPAGYEAENVIHVSAIGNGENVFYGHFNPNQRKRQVNALAHLARFSPGKSTPRLWLSSTTPSAPSPMPPV